MPKARGRGFKSRKHEDDVQEAQEEYFDESLVEDRHDKNLPFFGILDRTELEYFKTTESTLAANVFDTNEMRSAFINGVLSEAKGKELKLVTNAICSKLVERLILHASDAQLLRIFTAFNGHFADLAKHKYSSHCLETLLVQAAALVEREMRTDPQELYPADNVEFEEIHTTMTSQVLFMFNELLPHIKDLSQNAYGSHVVRILLLVFSGSELPTSGSTLRSKKSNALRSKIAIDSTTNQENNNDIRKHTVPAEFSEALDQALSALCGDLDVDSARKACIDKIMSPVMQVIISIETKMQNGNGTVINLIFGQPGDKEKNSSESGFVEYLLTDAVGVYFFESVAKDLSAKRLQRLYNLYMRDRLTKLINRDCANYIFPVLLDRLKTDDRRAIIDVVIDNMGSLIETSKFVLIRAGLAACKPGHYREKEFETKLLEAINTSGDKSFLANALKTTDEQIVKEANLPSWSKETPDEMLKPRAKFVQELVKSNTQFLNAAAASLESMTPETLVSLAKHSILCHVMEAILSPKVAPIPRKKIMNKLVGQITELAKNVYGSHQIDQLWRFAYQQKHLREQIALELAASENDLKSSMYGRIVWRNWHMDKYTRQRSQWWSIVNAQETKIKEEIGAVDNKPAAGPGKITKKHQHRSKPYDKSKK